MPPSLRCIQDLPYAYRFVLADTEKLHQKISEMSDRIRQLEDALAIFQSSVSSEPHPLLSRDLMKIKSSIELHAAIEEESKAQNGGIIRSKVDGETSRAGEEEGETVIDAFGTLAIRDDGAATFYGRSAGSEVSTASQNGTRAYRRNYPSTEFIDCRFRNLSRLHYIFSGSDYCLGRKVRKFSHLHKCFLLLSATQHLPEQLCTARLPALSCSVSKRILSLQPKHLASKLCCPN